MNLRGRLQRLEKRLPKPAPDDEPIDEDWLDWFAERGRDGFFAGEPEFAQALEQYRQAIDRAKAGQPPFDPPADFQRLPPRRQCCRAWRLLHSFAEVDAAFFWLGEMVERVEEGIPPITAAEFAELAVWFERFDEQASRQAKLSELLELGDGRTTDRTNLRYGIAQGPHARGASRLAQDLRRL